MKNIPKITNVQKLRRFFVGAHKLKKVNNLFFFFNLNVNKLMISYVGFFSLESKVVFYNQLFSVEKTLKKKLPKKIKIINNLPLVNAYTMKPSGVRMGKGKGVVKKYYGIIQKNSIFFEFFFNKPIEFYKFFLVYNEVKTKLPLRFKLKFLNY